VDIRGVQKEINSIGETSKRSFAIADETVFRVCVSVSLCLSHTHTHAHTQSLSHVVYCS